MTKALFRAAAVLAILVAAALAGGPYLVDWDARKPRVVAALEAATGRAVAVDGPLSFSVLWPPTLRAAGVRVSDGAGGDPASAAELVLELAVLPLATGTLRIANARLAAPDLLLERGADGAPNWQLAALEAALEGRAAPTLHGLPLAVDELSVADGRIRYRDLRAGIDHELTGLEFSLTTAPPAARTGARAARFVRGAARWRGRDLAWTASDDGGVLRARIESGGAVLAFDGAAPAGGGIAGRMALRGETAAALTDILAAATSGQVAPAAPRGMGVEGAARLAWEAGRFSARGLALRLGDMTVEGELAVSAAPPRLDAALSANRLDLDHWLEAGGAEPEADGQPPEAAPARLPFAGLPAGLRGDIDLAIGSVVYRGRIVRDAVLKAAFLDGTMVVHDLSAVLPGDTAVALSGAVAADPDSAPAFEGRVEAATDNPRTPLAWLGVAAPGVPADRLRRFRLAAALAADRRGGRLDDIALALDSTAVAGSAAWTLGPRAAFDLELGADRLNLDSWRGAAPAGEDGENDGGENDAPPGPPLAVLAGFDARFALDVGELTAAGLPMRGVSVAGAMADGALTVREARIDDLAGAAVSASGTVTGLGAEPAVDAAIRVRADDPSALASAIPVLPDLPPAAGPAALDARLEGGRDSVAVEAALSTPLGELTLRGAVAEPLATPFFNLTGTLQGPDLVRLLAAAELLDEGAAPPPLTGPVSVDARTIGVAAAMAFEADAVLGGGQWALRGKIDGDESARRFSIDATVRYADAARLLRVPDAADGPAAPGAALSGSIEAMGGAEAFEIKAGFELGGGALTLAGAVGGLPESPSFALTGALDHPDLAALLAGLGLDGGPAPGGAVRVRAGVSGGAAPESAARGMIVAGDLSASAGLAPALRLLAGIDSLSGPAELELNFQAAAAGRPWIETLRGDGALRGAGGRIDGFDLASLSAAVAAARETGGVRALAGLAALAAGGTDYRDLRGGFRIVDGRLRAPDLRLAADAADVAVSLDLDLPAWQHRVAASAAFHAHPDLPPLTLYRDGPIDAPLRYNDIGEAAKAIAVAAPAGRAAPRPDPPEPPAAPRPAHPREPTPPPGREPAAPLPEADTVPPPPEPPAGADDFDSMLEEFLAD